MTSISIVIGPVDKRCRYWAKVLRAGTKLPAPSVVKGANDIPGAYARTGDEELFPGDILIEGEANHHAKDRGWSYWVTWCSADGAKCRVRDPGTQIKADLKAAGLPAELLAGSGPAAACIRVAHGVALNLLTAPAIKEET